MFHRHMLLHHPGAPMATAPRVRRLWGLLATISQYYSRGQTPETAPGPIVIKSTAQKFPRILVMFFHIGSDAKALDRTRVDGERRQRKMLGDIHQDLPASHCHTASQITTKANRNSN